MTDRQSGGDTWSGYLSQNSISGICGVRSALWITMDDKSTSSTAAPTTAAKTPTPTPAPAATQIPIPETVPEISREAQELYEQGDSYLTGSKPNYNKAREYYEQAAALGHYEAMRILGNQYLRGRYDGGTPDYEMAEQWYMKSIALGYDRAANSLAELYAKAGDYAKAEEWYQKSAEMGYVPALDAIALGYIQGTFSGGVPDYEKAQQWCEERYKKDQNGLLREGQAWGMFKRETVDVQKAQIGDIVSYGTFERDNDLSNGKEPMHWQVIGRKDNRLLVLCCDALTYMPFHNEQTSVTWEKSSLRKWLNNEFLTESFTAAERKNIPVVTVKADKNPKYSEYAAGKDTKDQVFLLSIKEIQQYFDTDEAMECYSTPYATNKTPQNFPNYAGAIWWLRTPGYNQKYASYVAYDTGVNELGEEVKVTDRCAVRPAMWIDLSE